MRSSPWIILVLSGIVLLLGAGLLAAGASVSSAGGEIGSHVTASPPTATYVELLTLYLPDGIGDNPRAIAANPAAGLVYVANYQSDDISIVSGTHFLGTVYGGGRPLAVAADPSTGYAYVLDDWTNDVQVLSGTAHVGVIPLPSRSAAVAVDSQRGYGYILEYWNDIAVVRGTELITTVQVPTTSGWLSDIAVNPATGLVYASANSYHDMEVTSTVVIVSGTAIVANILLPGSYVYDIAVDPVHGYVYAASGWTTPSLTILSGTGVMTTAPLLSEAWQVAVDPPRGLAYVLCNEEVSVFSGTQWLGDVGTQPYSVPTLVVEPVSGDVYVLLRDFDDESYRLMILQGTTEVARVPLTEGSIDMGADGRGHVYLAHGSNRLSVWEGTALRGYIPSRASPAAFLADPARGVTYIANGAGSDTVSVVSGTELLANLPVLYGPVLLEPLGDLVYVASREEPGLSVLRGTEVLATIPVSVSAPWGWRNPRLAVEPRRGWAYATFSADSGIYVFSGTALLTTIPMTTVYDLAVDPLTGHLLVGGLGYRGLVVISGTEVISHVVTPWYVERLEADPRNGYVYAFCYYEWWALRAGEVVQSMGEAPDGVLVQPYSGLLYAMDDTVLTVYSGTHGLASTDLGFDYPYDTYADAGSDRFYMLYDFLEPGMGFRVWRGTEQVTVQAGLTFYTKIGSSPGGAYLYLTPAAGISGEHLVVWREVPLPYRFYLPRVDR